MFLDFQYEHFQCDGTVCSVFHEEPNIELLNDWLFCHNHAHKDIDKKHAKNNFNDINPDNFKPIVLKQLQQIEYLISNETEIWDCKPKLLLLESIANQNDSIYLQLFDSNWCASFYNYDEDNDLYHSNANDSENKMTFNDGYLVYYRIFTRSRHEERKLLTNYRMSFEIDWHRIEEKLFNQLSELLCNCTRLFGPIQAKLESNVCDSLKDPSLSIAYLNNITCYH